MAKPPVRKTLTYSGPVTPLDLAGAAEPVMLIPGRSYPDLLADDPTVAVLIARGLLSNATENAPEGAAN